MRLKNVVKNGLVLAAATSVLYACEYKKLEEVSYKPNSILLDFSWEHLDSIPASFRVVFYPEDIQTARSITKGYIVYDVYNTMSVLSNIPEGKYRVTAWNTDLEHTYVEGMTTRNSMAAITTPYASDNGLNINVLDSLNFGRKVMNTSDYLVHANEEMVTVYKGEKQPLTLHPDSMIVAVDCRVRGIKGLNVAKQISATLNNVAKRRYVAFDNLTNDTTAVMFNCKINHTDSIVYSHFNIFDIEPNGIRKEHKLTLFFWLEGKNIFIPIDVTNHIQVLNEGRLVVIDVPDLGIDLREYISGSGVFDISVGEWDDIMIDVPW